MIFGHLVLLLPARPFPVHTNFGHDSRKPAPVIDETKMLFKKPIIVLTDDTTKLST